MLIRTILFVSVAIVVVIVAGVHLTTRWLLRYLRSDELRLRAGMASLHERGAAAIAALEAAGYQLAAQGVMSIPAQGHRAVFLLRSPTGGSIAEVVVLDAGASDQVQIALESWLPGGRLSTQTVQGLIVLPGHLKQVFPEARVADLLSEHERALDALTAAGRPALPIALDEVEQRWAGALREDAERHPSGLKVLLRVLRIAHGHIEDRGSVIDRGLVG